MRGFFKGSLYYFYVLFFGASFSVNAQYLNNANLMVLPYNENFSYGTNLGYYPPHWTDKSLGDIAAGNPALGIEGAGVNSLRLKMPADFFEKWGYEILMDEVEHYEKLGIKNITGYLGFPSPSQLDNNRYGNCGGQSKLFKNMYEPIWDDGENGTPVNENNPYALYVYRTALTYKGYVKFWEIMNEPDYNNNGSGWKPKGEPNNWWENNPSPCDLTNMQAPIFHYIRMLRISYEVIKSIDSEAYVAIGGIGYESFLDAVLRNSDNPVDGSLNADFPLKGGAYFDVVSYHSYPHYGLKKWSNDVRGFIYYRHSDGAVSEVMNKKETLNDVLKEHGYNGNIYPEKHWIITESNVPRKKIGGEILAGNEAQVNFVIKVMVAAQKNNIKQLHTFILGDSKDYEEATRVFDLMGLYKKLNGTTPYSQKFNDQGIAYKTTSDLLYGLKYDPAKTLALAFPENVDGGAFKDKNSNYVYVLWAKTQEDNSEKSKVTYSLPKDFNASQIEIKNWDYGITKKVIKESSANVILTGTPIFFTIIEDTSPQKEINLSAKTESDTSIFISWNTNFNFSGPFSIERSMSKNQGFEEIAVYNEMSFNDVNLSPSTKYYYRVKAILSSNDVLYSNEASTTTEEEREASRPLAAPSSLAARAVSPSSVELSWSDRSGDETGFSVEVSEGGPGSFSQLAELPPNTTGYLSEGLSPGTTYYYRVRALRGEEGSPYSNIVSVSSLEEEIYIEPPFALEAKQIDSSFIQLVWESYEDTDFFIVERSIDDDKSFEVIGNTKEIYYEDKDAIGASTIYFYRVQAVYKNDTSDYSNQISIVSLEPTESDSDKQQEENLKGKDSVAVYPNPTLGDVFIYIKDNYKGEIKVQILDGFQNVTESLMLFKTKFEENFAVSINYRISGIYFIKISYHDNLIVKKIILK